MPLMAPVIKFPDMRAARRDPLREPPPPSEFRRVSPAIIASQPGVQPKHLSRRRLWVWLGVALALHIVVIVAIWLAPPLRVPWNPAPEDWVPVTSVPPPTSDTPAPRPPDTPTGQTTDGRAVPSAPAAGPAPAPILPTDRPKAPR